MNDEHRTIQERKAQERSVRMVRSCAEAGSVYEDAGVAAHNPLPAAKIADRAVGRQRTSVGLSQREAARRIGVDAATLARWRAPNLVLQRFRQRQGLVQSTCARPSSKSISTSPFTTRQRSFSLGSF